MLRFLNCFFPAKDGKWVTTKTSNEPCLTPGVSIWCPKLTKIKISSTISEMKTDVFSICVPVVVHSKHLFFLILLCCLRIFSVCFLVDFHQYALPCVFKLFLLFCHPANGRFLNYGLHPQIIIFCRYFTVNHPAIGVSPFMDFPTWRIAGMHRAERCSEHEMGRWIPSYNVHGPNV